MTGEHIKVYLATKGTYMANPNNNDFNIILPEPPMGMMYKTYIQEHVVIELLEKLRKVCGNRAMRYVDKQLKLIKG